MNIAFLAHDKKKELMVQFCTAYKSVLMKHNLFATATTGRLIAANIAAFANPKAGEDILADLLILAQKGSRYESK